MKKKILFVTGIFPPEIGGPATYVSNIIPEFNVNGFETHVITLGDLTNSSEITYISKRYSFFRRHYLLKKFIEKNNYDYIYVQDPFSFGFGVALAKTNAKKILKIVGDNVWEISRESLGVKDSIDDFQKNSYSLKIKLMKKIQAFTAKKMDQIIVPSTYLKSIVISWGIKDSKIEVIYNAIKELDYNKNISKNFKTKLEKKTFLTVARLTPWKGIELLIDIFKEREDILLIVGDGHLFNDFLKKTKSFSNIKLLGRLNKSQVYEEMLKADAFILNSGYEGLPHVVIEAFTLNLPVLLSNVCGNPEIVKDNYNGKLFNYDDKKSLLSAINSLDEKTSKIYTSNAHKSLNKFNWDNMLEQLFKVIEK